MKPTLNISDATIIEVVDPLRERLRRAGKDVINPPAGNPEYMPDNKKNK